MLASKSSLLETTLNPLENLGASAVPPRSKRAGVWLCTPVSVHCWLRVDPEGVTQAISMCLKSRPGRQQREEK